MRRPYYIAAATGMLLMAASLPMSVTGASSAQLSAAEQDEAPMVLPPLFEYPSAPEELEWNERSNWLVEHFWDNFNFKAKNVGQSQLNHAFRTYVVPLHLADKDKALASIEALVKKISKKPMLLLEFTAAAERYLYEPATAELMIDEAYVPFLRACVANKKIPELRKARYKLQLQALEHCLLGGQMPAFSYKSREGAQVTYTPGTVPTIIEFGDFDCSDCRIARLRLETDSELMSLVNEGKAKIMFISPDTDPDNADTLLGMAKDYPETWEVGQGSGLDEMIDLRIVPCLYLVDKNGVIVSKSANTDAARKFAKSAATE